MENVAKGRGIGEVLAFSELQTGTRTSQLTANSIVAQIVYTKNGGKLFTTGELQLLLRRRTTTTTTTAAATTTATTATAIATATAVPQQE